MNICFSDKMSSKNLRESDFFIFVENSIQDYFL